MTDPFEQFKHEMQPLPDPHAKRERTLRSIVTVETAEQFLGRPLTKPPADVVENLKAVSADEDEETARRAKKLNKKIEDWQKDETA